MPTTSFYNYPRPAPETTAVGRVRRQSDLDAAASGYGPGYCPEGIPIEQEIERDQKRREGSHSLLNGRVRMTLPLGVKT